MAFKIEEEMHDETPVLIVSGLVVEHPSIAGGRNGAVAVIETAIAPPRDDLIGFQEWALEEVNAAVRTKDDGQASRLSTWPDGSEHTVYRVWHLRQYNGNEQVSVWKTRRVSQLP